MRKESVEFSDKSSSSVLFHSRQSSHNEGILDLGAQKSSLEINMDQLLGEISDIKAENGLSLLEEVNQEEMKHRPKRTSDTSIIYQDDKSEDKKEEEEIRVPESDE